MAVRGSESRLVFGSVRQSLRFDAPSARWVAAATAPIAIVALVLPTALILPALSLILIALSVAVGLSARRIGDSFRVRGLTPWDVAGVFMVMGCIAGMLSDPQQALQLVGLVEAGR